MMGPNYEQAAAGLEAAVPDEHFKFFALLIIGHDRKIFPLPCWRAARNPAGAPKCVEDLLWIRDEFLKSRADFGRIVVHGHTPSEQPEILPNRINVDTGAFAPRAVGICLGEAAAAGFFATAVG
jgi:hypothetical protein